MDGDGAVSIQDALERSRYSAAERSQGLLCYPSGVLTIRSILAMNEVFILAFEPDERGYARGLIDQEADRG